MSFIRLLAAFLVSIAVFSVHAENYKIAVIHSLDGELIEQEVSVFVDGEKVGELNTTEAAPEAQLELTLSQPLHHYRFTGQAVDVDGTVHKIQGGGAIATMAYMDSLLEHRKTSVEVVTGYNALMEKISAAAPDADLSDLTLVAGQKYTADEIASAEKRLGISLPEDYKNLVQEIGAFRVGEASSVYGPDELLTVLDYYMKHHAPDDSGYDAIKKRYPRSTRDVVMDHFEVDEFSVLRAKHRCRSGQYGLSFPGYDFYLVATPTLMESNPFMALIDYDDDIMGEVQCISYPLNLGWGLHDFLIDEAEYVLFIADGDASETEEVVLGRDYLHAAPDSVYLTFMY